MITKGLIIEAFKSIYEQTGANPTGSSPNLPCSRKTISKYFGSWNDALIAAGLTPTQNAPLSVECQQCGKIFQKQVSDIKKSPNHFCSHSCSATYSNSRRVISDEQKLKTSNALRKNPIRIKPVKIKKDNNKVCITCGISFEHKSRKTCSDECHKQILSEKGKSSGIKAGRASQASQPRRSKGETLFFDLCVQYFGSDKVLSNPQMFIDKNGNYWDADIVILDYKVAICYNGIWHYQKVAAKHNLEQVQSRDAIKEKIIFNNGYIQYIIKDLGKFNQGFVYEQFHRFIYRTFIHFELLSRFDDF